MHLKTDAKDLQGRIDRGIERLERTGFRCGWGMELSQGGRFIKNKAGLTSDHINHHTMPSPGYGVFSGSKQDPGVIRSVITRISPPAPIRSGGDRSGE